MGVLGYFKSYITGEDSSSSSSDKRSLQEQPDLKNDSQEQQGGQQQKQKKQGKQSKTKQGQQQATPTIIKEDPWRLDKRKENLIQIYFDSDQWVKSMDNRLYSKIYNYGFSVQNPERSMWTFGALGGAFGYIFTNSFVKNYPLQTIKSILLISATFGGAYYSSNVIYENVKDEIPLWREQSLDIIDFRDNIKEILPIMYRNERFKIIEEFDKENRDAINYARIHWTKKE
ncbi:hypothetical protein DFA_04762 [Cavenderia fasciculata]|uniref:Uncharacterized protein n=1 Tax=Cavenderia fasciculata TaxID=261658 RepID=F4PQG9_CACFS|nr:uncharacterized protein DFA_04762 [Cavenderia fasciculata]EGG22632.1 hypothetical protein DFA_04762 [Cavenderia fasciculata]|eukprot:XP_004360483.1 hypothetical protein DFA_04762 [Cavenderia fasciculata]